MGAQCIFRCLRPESEHGGLLGFACENGEVTPRGQVVRFFSSSVKAAPPLANARLAQGVHGKLLRQAMFGRPKKKTPPPETPAPPHPLRETLFGDLDLQAWTAAPGSSEPGFAIELSAAREAIAAGRDAAAIAHLEKVAALPGLESRVTLMAWHHLAKLGVQPPADIAKKVHGVVLEVWMKEGLDLLAAYADGSARYINYTGNAIIWDAPGSDSAIEASLRALLAAGQAVADRIGPWEGGCNRPPAPPFGLVRLNMLTPSGIHFGQGQYGQLNADPMGAALLGSGVQLMRILTERKGA